MNLGKTGKSRHHLIDLRIVFHGAGTQRIELALDSEISVRETSKMAQHLQLSQFGESRDILAQELPGIVVWPFSLSAGQ